MRDADTNTRILHSLIPFKHDNDQLIPFGFLFIGLETHQSSGIGMHIFSHFIPTIERENLDLQDPYLSRWNQDLLASAGQIVRYEYDQTIRSNTSSRNSLAASLVAYSFQPSVPNKEIGKDVTLDLVR